MEFHIKMVGPAPDIDTIQHAIQEVDPSALVDIDPAGETLRVATSVNAVQLVSLINQSGYRVAQPLVTQLPSTCCGGCSG